MERILINQTPNFVGKTVRIKGWVNVRRDHGKLIFIDLRDRSGSIQMVVIPGDSEVYDLAKTVRNEFVLDIKGLVKARPISAINQESATGGVEIEVKSLKILSRTEGDLPVEISNKELDLNLDTLLNHRHLTLRNEKVRGIFKIYSEILKAYSEIMRSEGFTEIKTPKILSNASEGGANFFKIKYFEREAFLAQSPQFYKQAGIGVFERVFEVGTVFRAEPHFTSRHVNEYVSLDAEMGFIESFEDIMNQLERTFFYLMDSVERNCKEEIKKYDLDIPARVPIPRLRLDEALDILEREFGKKRGEEIDIDGEGERLIGEWAKKSYGSDLVFLTHYPTYIRPFYTMPSSDGKFTESFDLIFRGLEIATGGQRINDYEQLVNSIKKNRLNPEDFAHYLDIFKYGMPPHGGWGMGSERISQKLFGLDNIKEAILFPRDVKRLTP